MEIPDGNTILEAAYLARVRLQTDCEYGYCGTDAMVILSGQDRLSPPEGDEVDNLAHNKFPANVRMACVTRVYGDVVVERFTG